MRMLLKSSAEIGQYLQKTKTKRCMHSIYVYTIHLYVRICICYTNIYFYFYLAHDLCERKASFLTYKTNHLHWVSILCTCLNRAASRPAVCDGLPHHASWCPAGVVGGSAVGVFGVTMSQEKEKKCGKLKGSFSWFQLLFFFLRFFQICQTHAFLM